MTRWLFVGALLVIGTPVGYALRRPAVFIALLLIGGLLLSLGLGPLDRHGGLEGPGTDGIRAVLLQLSGAILLPLGAGGTLGALLSARKRRADPSRG